jgi:carboxymethylenebutenolidase
MSNKPEFDADVLRLFDGYVHGAMSRRQFLDRVAAYAASGVTAAGLLAALSPDYALAQQVAPDDKSIIADYKKYESPDGAGVMRGYFARPAAQGHRLPGIVVVHENRGLNPYIEDVARRLAIEGYIGFAPDALTPLGGYPGNDDDGRKLQQQRDGDAMFADFRAAVDFLRRHPDCSGKVGAVGFCFGGSMSLRLAAAIPDLNAAVAFYGRHPDAASAASIQAPLMIHHGALDERVNAGWPDFEQALEKYGIEYEEYTYADANHGFHNDTTPRFDEDAAQLAWQRTVKFFDQHLK